MTIEDAVAAITSGDTARLEQLLRESPGLVHDRLAGNGRSLLHHATDWPGHWPNVGATIRLLIAAGADPDVAMPPSDSPGVAETPLHWAASSDDVEAADALLAAGATVDALGGIFDGCTPFPEAIIFEKYRVARMLLAHGATNFLPGAAALGMSIEHYFDDDGRVRLDIGLLPHWSEPPDPRLLLDRAFQFACRAGHLDIARSLFERGADIDALTPAGTSARDEASKHDHREVVGWLDSLPTR